MELSPNAFAWIGVGLALLGIGSQFSDYRSNWLTVAFGIVAVLCFIPALRESFGLSLTIKPERLSIFIMGGLGFILFATATWIYQRSSEISAVNSATDTTPTPAMKAPNQSTPTPEQTPVKVPEQHERIVVGDNITAEYLMNMFREPGRTTFQGSALLEPYLGKWMKVSGVMRDVSKSEAGYFAQMTFERDPSLDRTNWLYHTALYMLFRESWIPRVLILKRGQKVTVIGQIDRVTSYDMQLGNCELVDSKP